MPADLDSPEVYERLDPSGMRRRIRSLGAQVMSAWEDALEVPIPRSYAGVSSVVVAGMGGSAIGGDLLADLVSSQGGGLPITVHRGYGIPGWVDEDTLVIACSYSGETEETLSAFRQALRRGARVVAITSGGTLAREAQEAGVPLFTVEFRGEPRCALGHLFIPQVALLRRLGALPDGTADVEETASLLESLPHRFGETVPTSDNPAKGLACSLQGGLAVIYGALHLTAVARRWKTQINENAKAWAFAEQLPELHHNSVVGYALPQEVRRLARVVMLLPAGADADTRLRYSLTADLLSQEGIPHETVEAPGGSTLAQMLGTVMLGDYVSYYLALLNGVDPARVDAIDRLKAMMRRARGSA